MNPDLVRVPPLSVPVHQRIVEKLVKDGDGETKRVAQLQRESLAVTAKTSDAALDLVCFDVLTVSESASSGTYHSSQILILVYTQLTFFIPTSIMVLASVQYRLELNM